MKHILFVFLCVVCVNGVRCQIANSDFEDGTLQGWTNIDGTTSSLSNELNGDDNYLLKIADGSSSAVGRMSISNQTETWTGDFYNDGTTVFSDLSIYAKNENNFDLDLRFGIRGGSDNTIFVTTEPKIVPAFSGWNWYFIDFDYTIVNGNATEIEVLENVHEFRIIVSDEVSWDGDQIAGELAISTISGGYVLSNDQVEKKEIKIRPNPFQDFLRIELPLDHGTVHIFDVLGRKILTGDLKRSTTLDLRKLKRGIYLANVITESGSVTKRIIKN